MQRMWRMKVETAGYRMIGMLVQSLLKQHSKVSPNDPSREKSSQVLRGKMLWMWVCNRPNVVEDTIINKDWADTHQRWQRLFQLCDNESFFFFPLYLFIFLYIFAAMRLCNFILIKNLFFFVNFIHVCNIFCQFIPTPLWDLPTHPLLTSCDPPTPSLSLSGSLSPMRASAGKFTDVVLILYRWLQMHWVHEHRGHVTSRWQHFTMLLSIFQLLPLFPPLPWCPLSLGVFGVDGACGREE